MVRGCRRLIAAAPPPPQRLHEMAGYSVASITAESCVSLNGRPWQRFFVPGADLGRYIDRYWVPFTSCVGSWVEALRPLPWFADEAAFAERTRGTPPYCEPREPKFAEHLESQLSYYELHRRAGVHLVPHAPAPAVMPSACYVGLTSKRAGAARPLRAEDVRLVLCWVFFRRYEYFTRLMDVVAVGHPLFNATDTFLRRVGARARTPVEATRPLGAPGEPLTLVKELALMYGLDPLWNATLMRQQRYAVLNARRIGPG